MSVESLLAGGSYDATYREAVRDADEADAASQRARAHLLAFAGGRAAESSEWPGHACRTGDDGETLALAAVVRAGRGALAPSATDAACASTATPHDAFAPTSSELALASLLVASPPRAIARSGPAGTDAARDGSARAGARARAPAIRTAAGAPVPPAVGLGATVSAAAGMGPGSGRRGGACVDLYELDPKVRWWRVDNAYIYFGYRKPPPPKLSMCAAILRAVCTLVYPVHNQTANVWTHLCGALTVAALAASTLGADGPMRGGASGAFRASSIDLLAEGGFLFGALACLLLSATFHLLCDTSLRLRRFLIKLDFAGVLCLVWGSWLPLLQFGLACRDVRWRVTYAAVITAGVGAVAVLCLLPRFATPAYQPVRAGVFMFIGWVGAVPAVQLLADARTRPIGLGVIEMGLLYSVGTAIDVLRMPERFFYAAAPPSVVLSAVGGAKSSGDDGVMGSSARNLAAHADASGVASGCASGGGSIGCLAPSRGGSIGSLGSFGASSPTRSAVVHAAHAPCAARAPAADGARGWARDLCSGPPSPTLGRGHSSNGARADAHLELGGGSGGGCHVGGPGVPPGAGSVSASASMHSLIALRPNTVTATILGSRSAVNLVANGPVEPEVEAELCQLAAQDDEVGTGGDRGCGARGPPSLLPPHIAAMPSMLDHVRAAQRNARDHLGACAPLLCVWGSHATFHCFVVAAVVTHYRTSMIAWEFKTRACAA